jgi:hypothetical protein
LEDRSLSATQAISFIARSLPDSRRLIRPLVVGVVVGAVLLGSVATALARPKDDHTLRVTWHLTGNVSTQIDPTKTEPATGDTLAGGAIVLRYAAPHDQIGTAGLFCVWVEAGDTELQCQASFYLPDGKITTQSVFRPADGDLRTLAISGGTGAYRGATGVLTVTSINDTDELGVFSFDK